MFIYADRFFMIGTMILGCVSLLCCESKRKILPVWPVWLTIFACLKLYILPYDSLCMHGVFNIFMGCGLFYLVANYADNRKMAYEAIAIAVSLNIIYGAMNQLGYNPIFKYDGLPAAFFATNSDLAGYLILTIPIMGFFIHGFGFFPPLLFSITFLQSFSAVICAGLAGLVMSVRRGLFPMIPLVILTIISVAFIHTGKLYSLFYKLGYRFPLWAEAAKGAFRKPLSGYGFCRGIHFTPSIGEGSFTFKSDYLEFAFEAGIVLALLFVGYMGKKLVDRYKAAIKTGELKVLSIALTSFLLSLMVQSHLRNPKIAPTFIVLLAFFYILTEKKGKSDVI